jgi:hypothetical protein
MMSGAVLGPDGLLRCPWALSASEYLAYHDDEWGRPVSTVQGLYERMTLEAFQSGLSWITILRKRENFRRAFAGFWPERVAAFTDDDMERLLSDSGHRPQPGEDRSGHRERTVGGRSRPEVCRDRSELSGDRPSATGRRGVACHLTRVDWNGARAQGPGLPIRRPDDGVRDNASDRPGRRSCSGLLRATAGLAGGEFDPRNTPQARTRVRLRLGRTE